MHYVPGETSILNRCLVQPTGCDQQPKSSQLRTLGEDGSLNVIGWLPRPRDAYVCPLDSVGLIGVSQSALLLHFQVFVGGGGGA